MIKIAISGIVLGAAFGAAPYADPERMTGSTPVPVILAQVTPGNSSASAFDAGLADRRAYEEWFASLTGDFKKGAEYWAGQRSVTKPGSCYLADGTSAGDWTQGCLAAQRRLGPTDKRRLAEPDYRQGWNSYTEPASPSVASTPDQKTAAPGPAATATPPLAASSRAYAEGLADRRAWEHYFDTLYGQTREGAEWWTSHRIEKDASCQPTTTEQQGQWQTGCLSAKRQLAPTDKRRLAEPDYRLGWNSYAEPASQRTTAPAPAAPARGEATPPPATAQGPTDADSGGDRLHAAETAAMYDPAIKVNFMPGIFSGSALDLTLSSLNASLASSLANRLCSRFHLPADLRIYLVNGELAARCTFLPTAASEPPKQADLSNRIKAAEAKFLGCVERQRSPQWSVFAEGTAPERPST